MIAWPTLKEKLLIAAHEVLVNRAKNALARDGIFFIGQVYLATEARLLRAPGLGGLSADRIKDTLHGLGLSAELTDGSDWREILQDGFSDATNVPKFRVIDEEEPTPAYYKRDGNFINPTQSAMKHYFASGDVEAARPRFAEFLEQHKQYFQKVADPNWQDEICPDRCEREKAVVREPVLAQYPSTEDWILQHLPSDLRDHLSAEFMDAVLNSREVRAKIQKVVSEAVLEKLGFDFKN